MNAPGEEELLFFRQTGFVLGFFMEWTNECDLAVPPLLFKISTAGKVFHHWTPVVGSTKPIK